jgi:hypothetical protein
MTEATVQPVILTANLERMITFYTTLFDATPVARVPSEGPAFYVGLRIGSSVLGLVAGAEAASDGPSRILLSWMSKVSTACWSMSTAPAAACAGRRMTCRGGSASPT